LAAPRLTVEIPHPCGKAGLTTLAPPFHKSPIAIHPPSLSHFPRLARRSLLNWPEAQRVAQLPEYRNLKECDALVREVSDELKIKNPFNPD
jgi:hypothetical protein